MDNDPINMLESIPTKTATVDVGRCSIGIRIYGTKPKAGAVPSAVPVVVHFHGGNFTTGDLDTGSRLSRLIASAGAVVVSVDYPLAPKNPFPQAVEAGFATLQWAAKNKTKLGGANAPLFVAGEEAGGNLAAGVAVMARDRLGPPLAGQILVTPMLDPRTGTASLRSCMGECTDSKWARGWCDYLQGPMDIDHPYAVPSQMLRLAGMPRALILTSSDDPMHDEALAYADRLSKAGSNVTTHIFQNTGWPESLDAQCEKTCQCTADIQQYLKLFLHEKASAPS